MDGREVRGVSRDVRDALFERVRTEPEFRELMKKDWRAALQTMHVDPEAVLIHGLNRREVVPLGPEVAAGEYSIIIVKGRPMIELREVVSFEAR